MVRIYCRTHFRSKIKIIFTYNTFEEQCKELPEFVTHLKEQSKQTANKTLHRSVRNGNTIFYAHIHRVSDKCESLKHHLHLKYWNNNENSAIAISYNLPPSSSCWNHFQKCSNFAEIRQQPLGNNQIARGRESRFHYSVRQPNGIIYYHINT